MRKIVDEPDIQALLAKDEILKAVFEQYGTLFVVSGLRSVTLHSVHTEMVVTK
ncbi:MAG: hypothetical protein M9887_09300 [Chitinophagales bacterium]|nr:hypothetical protein [Chitinophagales bacterium]